MPNFRPSPDLDMHYEVDDFTDPWRRPETILLLHGNAESGLAWWPLVAFACLYGASAMLLGRLWTRATVLDHERPLG